MNRDTLLVVCAAVVVLLFIGLSGCTQVHLTGDGCVSIYEGGVTARVGGEAHKKDDCTGDRHVP